MASVAEQNALAQQIGLALPYICLLIILIRFDVALDGARTPREGAVDGDGGPVPAQAGGEAATLAERDASGSCDDDLFVAAWREEPR
jgi:hypothetical protein